MTKVKYLGIWMDHSTAYLMGFSTNPIETKIIKSNFSHEEKELSMTKGENRMHNKEQQQQAAYYKELGEAIINYEEVVLFGPTDAKVELLNILKANHHFDKIKIEVKQTDKMTENQQHAFVREYFSKH
ncbi:hypothetical protein [Emticicia sp. SJ17W-69]|uniref:hypothetical protein n=1 Tax=Emticicia sp. SJ17W-69 TaxID=3421657 RepID=UPI003EBA855E